MKNTFWITLFALTPFLLLISVNEYVRSQQREMTYRYNGIATIHNAEITPEYCTWHCHHNTKYCKQHHLTFLKSSVKLIDPLYWGIIGMLGSTGNYSLANVIFLVLLWPACMLALLIWIGRMYRTLQIQRP